MSDGGRKGEEEEEESRGSGRREREGRIIDT